MLTMKLNYTFVYGSMNFTISCEEEEQMELGNEGGFI